MTDPLKVPDIEGPIEELCWQQTTEGDYRYYRCDRRRHHEGMHTWEYLRHIEQQFNELQRLRAEVIDLNRRLRHFEMMIVPTGNPDGSS